MSRHLDRVLRGDASCGPGVGMFLSPFATSTILPVGGVSKAQWRQESSRLRVRSCAFDGKNEWQSTDLFLSGKQESHIRSDRAAGCVFRASGSKAWMLVSFMELWHSVHNVRTWMHLPYEMIGLVLPIADQMPVFHLDQTKADILRRA